MTAYLIHGLLHVCVHAYMAYMCESVEEGVCWFEAIDGMLVEMNRGGKQGTRKAECWSV